MRTEDDCHVVGYTERKQKSEEATNKEAMQNKGLVSKPQSITQVMHSITQLGGGKCPR